MNHKTLKAIVYLMFLSLVVKGQNIDDLNKKEIKTLYIASTTTSDSLRQLLTEKLSRLKNLEVSLTQKNNELASYQSKLGEYSGEIALLEEKIKNLENQLVAQLELNRAQLKQKEKPAKSTFIEDSLSLRLPNNLKIDTIISHVNIENKLYTITQLRDKYDAEGAYYGSYEDEGYGTGWEASPITLLISDAETKDVVHLQKINIERAYCDFSFFKKNGLPISATGNLYTSIIHRSPSPYFGATIYHIRMSDGKLEFFPIFHFNEISFVLEQKDKDAFLVLRAIWDMSKPIDSPQFEAHYGDHRYVLEYYSFKNETWTKQELGKTAYKYIPYDEFIFNSIKNKEPLLLKNFSAVNFNVIALERQGMMLPGMLISAQ
jgi:hypothetical protein